jgi:carbon monoxide dehydrogenase subunit G
MRFSDTIRIAAPQEKVWAFLLDPHKMSGCGPGVESVVVVDDTHYQAIVKVGIGQFRARFNADIELVELEPPSRASMRGRGNAPGTAVDATAQMSLKALDATHSEMAWEANVNISGKLAAVGSKLIEWQARKLIGQTFDCIKTQLEA